MSDDTQGPILYKCPYCSARFRGRHDFNKAVAHIKEKHSRAGVQRERRRRRDPYDFMFGGSTTGALLSEAPV